MGALQSLKQAFSNHTETNDHHHDPNLRSHYYKTTAPNGFKTVKEMVEKIEGFHILAAYEDRGEISVNIKKGRKAFMVITVISLRPFETAVDLSVTTETKVLPFDFGYSKQLVKAMYEQLDKKLVLVRQGSTSVK
ncbi:cytosolic protein [Metabacillus iocasae]|uniref:Cytosolic protein n=1 Tax=Priestia iocasae TaxID=2291674 RepID=A0ABS2QP63_9BACI|nr:cytosolic protein [Metabacillus iocasae]MBM7701249.1 hypothetical protein [Metabacillus iocasae]